MKVQQTLEQNLNTENQTQEIKRFLKEQSIWNTLAKFKIRIADTKQWENVPKIFDIIIESDAKIRVSLKKK